MAAKPGQLPFRVTAAGLLDFRDAFHLRDFAGNKRENFAKAESLGRCRADTFRTAHLFDNAAREHFCHAAIDPLVELGSIALKSGAGKAAKPKGKGGTRRVLHTERTAAFDAKIEVKNRNVVINSSGLPVVMGRSMDLNATTVILACLFWDLVWGTPGLFLAMPIMAGVKAVCHALSTWS